MTNLIDHPILFKFYSILQIIMLAFDWIQPMIISSYYCSQHPDNNFF